MISYQQLLKLVRVGLCLIICVLGCNDAHKKRPVDTSQRTEKPAQKVQTKRASRTPTAFREAIAAGQVGAIRGQVSFKGILPALMEIPVTLDKHVCGAGPKKSEGLLISEQARIQNAVVSLLKIPKGFPSKVPEQLLRLDQRECVFIPHILIVRTDTQFEVLNSDRAMHNFHATGTLNKEININQTKTRRRQLPFSYPHPDVVRVVCDVHSWMKAWIIVTEHPYYAVTDQEGQFRLENVPDGNYRIKAWHEELGEQIREATVTTNQDAILDFEFSQPL